jgi:hypothetical protein
MPIQPPHQQPRQGYEGWKPKELRQNKSGDSEYFVEVHNATISLDPDQKVSCDAVLKERMQ